MHKNGPILIIEDDLDDQYVLSMIMTELGYINKLLFFQDGDSILEFLDEQTIHPFLILSDVHMPKIGGIDLKSLVQSHQSIKNKYVPYIFLSTSGSFQTVYKAAENVNQGYFMKPSAYQTLRETIKRIIEYWQSSFSPEFIESAWDANLSRQQLN